MKYISARVGYASTAFTGDVYGHRTLNVDFRQAELFNSILKINESAQ